MTVSAPILVVGQSHTEALISAARTGKYPEIEIANLNARDPKLKLPEKFKMPGYLPDPAGRKLVASMIGGNFHNTFGLIENVIRFDFSVPGEADFVPQADRQLISYELIRHYFTDVMNRGFLTHIKSLKEHYAPNRFILVCSPPPIPDSDFIAGNPGRAFRDRIHLGVTPAKLRRKLYDLHTLVISEFCTRERIEMLPPPPGTVTVDGFLARQYWKDDPTHANRNYGLLVLDQLRKMLAS